MKIDAGLKKIIRKDLPMLNQLFCARSLGMLALFCKSSKPSIQAMRLSINKNWMKLKIKMTSFGLECLLMIKGKLSNILVILM